jgi:two-component system NtrC family response regulator
LRQEARQRRFREDLYFRLNVLEVRVPPLRERLEDLPLLVNSLLARLSRKNRLEARRIAPAFLDALAGYSWPGNVRELENILERALILSRSDILDTETLPDYILHRDGPPAAIAPQAEPWRYAGEADPGGRDQDKYRPGQEEGSLPEAKDADGVSPLEQAEYEALLRTLRRCGGHRERTAAALGVSRRTLQYKLKKFGLVR